MREACVSAPLPASQPSNGLHRPLQDDGPQGDLFLLVRDGCGHWLGATWPSKTPSLVPVSLSRSPAHL